MRFMFTSLCRKAVALGVCTFGLATSLSISLRSQVDAKPDWPVPTDLRGYIERFTGPAAIECGQLGAVPDRESDLPIFERVIACGRQASKSQQAFWVIEWLPDLDSTVCRGLLGSADGTIYRFGYDSAPCGGPGCGSRFTVERCPIPVPQDHGFTCRVR